jgi:predicted ATP-grasp superfamily ATP-dependent carboligase
MRVFIYEYTCSLVDQGHADAESLGPEGLAMLLAVMEDFHRVDGVEVVTLVSERLAGRLPEKLPRRTHAGDEEQTFRELAHEAAFSMIIAPEFARLLETRCAWALDAGGRLLGPSPDAVRRTADKLALGQYLQALGMGVPRAALASDMGVSWSFPVVVKPRHGAGSIATFLVRSPQELGDALVRARKECPHDDILVQQLVRGRAVSVAFLIGPEQRLALVPADQHLSEDGRFHYRGGRLPVPAALAERATSLARRALDAVPGLSGYSGVDLVLGDAADGHSDWVIEINPRLTTSYVGLRALARFNLAEAMLKIACGEPPGDLTWKETTITFSPDCGGVLPS